jgi:hypothetical protein
MSELILPNRGRGRSEERAATKSRATRQLEILALRCVELADRVAEGQLKFLDAIDVAYEAAVWSGLVQTVGDDIVQATMAASFANARRPGHDGAERLSSSRHR